MPSLEQELRGKGITIDDDFSLSPEKLQTPLNVALAISPLFLLGTRQLANLSMGKPKLLYVCTNSHEIIAYYSPGCRFGQRSETNDQR
jgi:hypothetical protein